MKHTVQIIFVLACLALSISASKSNTRNQKITNLLSVKSSAQGAVGDALQLLEDLLNSNNQEQTDADALNSTQETAGTQQISDLTEVCNENQDAAKSAQDNIDALNAKLDQQNQQLVWLAQRLNTLEGQKSDETQKIAQSNFKFIQSIKEHKDAIAIIDSLKSELSGYSSSGSSLSQIKEFGAKLQAYSNLFEKQQLQDFLQLGRENYEDNDQAGLSLDSFQGGANNVANGVVGDKLIAALNELQAHLSESLQNLEDNEIQSNLDFATWLQHVEDEETRLGQDQSDANDQIQFLSIEISVAQEGQYVAQQATDSCRNTQQAAVDDLNAKREAYAALTQRLSDESALLEDVITIFKSQVANLSDQLNSRVDDYVSDQTFDETSTGQTDFGSLSPVA